MYQLATGAQALQLFVNINYAPAYCWCHMPRCETFLRHTRLMLLVLLAFSHCKASTSESIQCLYIGCHVISRNARQTSTTKGSSLTETRVLCCGASNSVQTFEIAFSSIMICHVSCMCSTWNTFGAILHVLELGWQASYSCSMCHVTHGPVYCAEVREFELQARGGPSNVSMVEAYCDLKVRIQLVPYYC